MENYWPEIDLEESGLSPKEILEEQANFLPKTTNGKLFGEVVDYSSNIYDGLDEYKETDFCYRFLLKSKFMSNYQFAILTIFHNIEMYPVEIKADDAIMKELTGSIRGFISARNEEELKLHLKQILNSEKIKAVMSSLIKLSK